MPASPYDLDLPRCDANFAPLTPLDFIARAAAVYPQRLAVVHGALRQTWGRPMPVRGGWPVRCSARASARTTRWR